MLPYTGFFIPSARSRFIGCSGDFFFKELSCFLTTTRAEGIKTIAVTSALAYNIIVINCTTAESVLVLVSTFRLACSSHRHR